MEQVLRWVEMPSGKLTSCSMPQANGEPSQEGQHKREVEVGPHFMAA